MSSSPEQFPSGKPKRNLGAYLGRISSAIARVGRETREEDVLAADAALERSQSRIDYRQLKRMQRYWVNNPLTYNEQNSGWADWVRADDRAGQQMKGQTIDLEIISSPGQIVDLFWADKKA